MKRKRYGFTWMFGFLPLLLLTACAQPPETELQTAEEALRQAREAEADVYAPEQLEAAQQAFESARSEIEAQSQRFSPLRSYGSARELLEAATRGAQEAAVGAREKREEAQREAEALQEEASSALQEAEAALRQAPRRGKGAQADIAALRQDLESAQSAYDQGRQALQREEYPAAVSQFQQAREQALTNRSQTP